MFSGVRLLSIAGVFAMAALAPVGAVAQPAPSLTPMVFFVAKGPADSCGTGCDTWIAAHGDFDLASASRFETFLKKIGKRNLPIFFHSGGGSLTRAIAVGKLLRAHSMTVGVGYTVPLECGGYATSLKCRKAVSSGRDLESMLTKGGRCASACIYALVGGSRREIFDAAQLQIHAYRMFTTKGGKHVAAVSTKRAAQANKKFDIEAERYMTSMGVPTELLTAMRAVPFEQLRALTPEEVVRFGIDTRSR